MRTVLSKIGPLILAVLIICGIGAAALITSAAPNIVSQELEESYTIEEAKEVAHQVSLMSHASRLNIREAIEKEGAFSFLVGSERTPVRIWMRITHPSFEICRKEIIENQPVHLGYKENADFWWPSEPASHLVCY